MKARLLGPDAPAWTDFLGRARHDFYHLPAYSRMCAASDGGTAQALLVEDGERALLLPVVVRAIPNGGGALDATSPYGYPGTLVLAPETERAAFAREALFSARELLKDQNWVTLFVRQNPILGPAVDFAGAADAATVPHGETIAIDLTRSEEELWSDTMSGHRNEINRSLRANHVVQIDIDFEHVDRFVEIYQQTMTRVGASAGYFFDRAYVVALKEALGARLFLAVVRIGDVIAASGLFAETCGIVQYHLSGTDTAFLKDRPTKVMLHHVRSWAKKRGNAVFHLGGGVGGARDTLFKFKAGFSSGRAAFHTLRLVIDPPRYESLCAEKRSSATAHDSPAGDAAAVGQLTGFFPAYRR